MLRVKFWPVAIPSMNQHVPVQPVLVEEGLGSQGYWRVMVPVPLDSGSPPSVQARRWDPSHRASARDMICSAFLRASVVNANEPVYFLAASQGRVVLNVADVVYLADGTSGLRGTITPLS